MTQAQLVNVLEDCANAILEDSDMSPCRKWYWYPMLTSTIRLHEIHGVTLSTSEVKSLLTDTLAVICRGHFRETRILFFD
jgi:hypothetical protein